MPSVYLEKVMPENNMKRFYFISDEHQYTFTGYPVTIIFGRIFERHIRDQNIPEPGYGYQIFA